MDKSVSIFPFSFFTIFFPYTMPTISSIQLLMTIARHRCVHIDPTMRECYVRRILQSAIYQHTRKKRNQEIARKKYII